MDNEYEAFIDGVKVMNGSVSTSQQRVSVPENSNVSTTSDLLVHKTICGDGVTYCVIARIFFF